MEEINEFKLLDDEDEHLTQSQSENAQPFSRMHSRSSSSQSFTNESKISVLKINPNKPNAKKIELKSIDRPRSHSPLKLNGIEDYIQQYEKRKSTENLTHIPNKITMNLKMDDLLASKNESASYQMLSDFSVLTGDIEEFTSKINRKKATDSANDDFEDDDDENDPNEAQMDTTNLNYKYTAVYRKDQATGSFQEQSKIVFEHKKGESMPFQPVKAKSSFSPPPNPKSQIELALEALKKNSEKLDSKLEKLDDITPSSNAYYDISPLDTDPAEGPLPEIKKKNEDFFHDILSKSDNLIAQTQNKLERLSKLDTMSKPLAPVVTDAVQEIPKPTACLATPESSLNNSKSLIDLKTSQSQINIPDVSNTTQECDQVDLIFDLNLDQFVPVDNSIRPEGSYFDLLGLESSEPAQVEIMPSFNIDADLLDLNLDFKAEEPVASSIDIQISEPIDEINDSNIVPEDYFKIGHEIPRNESESNLPQVSRVESPVKTEPVTPVKFKEEMEKKIVWTKGDREAESSSSSDEDEIQKFQVRIRPKANKQEICEAVKPFVPLLPKPPKSAEEIEELRLRRQSSETGSIIRSIKESSSSDDENPIVIKQYEERKESVKSEFNLELPDDDDSLPLDDFNEKCELSNYSDGSYGCIVLVRQPFRNANIMYKNALQKVTEVRTWTECLVKLIDSEIGGKKLVFFNAHELITLAAEKETTIDDIIETCVINKVDALAEQDNEKIRPFHEIELKESYKFTDMCLQQYDNFSKIHTFKIQDIIFKETLQMRPDRIMALPERFLKKFTKAKVTSLMDHTPLPFEICKFGHLSFSYLRSFLLLLQDAFWSIPTITRKKQREKQLQQIQSLPIASAMSFTAAAASFFSLGSNKQIQNLSLNSVTANHTREEITVKVVDEYRAKLDKESRIKEHKSRTRVFLTVFLNSDDPILEIGMNDILRHGKEIVGRLDIIPIKTEQWISPEVFELNEKVVDKEEFEKTHCLRCVQMPDNLLVEIMRFRTRPRRNYELPLQVRCFMSTINRRVEIRIECTVAGSYFTNVSDVYCEDIQIRFPLPDVWVYLFRVEKMFRYGAVHSTKTKLGKIKGLDRLLLNKTGHQAALMEASCGTAKYEQAFKSLVWRINQLPVKNKDIYKTQLFICRLNLQEYDQFPDNYDEIAQVQYSIPICASSKSQVRSVSVNQCDEPPEKWAKLKSKFEYDLDINYAFDQAEIPKLDMEKCAELQQLSQTESEADNNEDDD